MATSFEKSVKGATKVKLAPPKTKYIEHILIATHAGEAGVGEVFRALQFRLRESAWTTVFKSLVTVHLMIREGSPNITLAYLAPHRNLLMPTAITDGQLQGRNIRHYSSYLSERAKAYRETKIDWVRARESILEKMTVDKGLLRETEAVQYQLTALLKCDVVEVDGGNEITVFVFRLLVLDLLSLFQVLNQAMINILGHFFEMSKVDAERAMQIYRNFTKQTDYVVQYLTVARQFEPQTRVEVPKLKHAPVNLGRQLDEYLRDPDFEVHRRQYLAELAAKKSGGGSAKAMAAASSKSGSDNKATSSGASFPSVPKPQQTKGPDPDLIDFFGSLEQNQTTMVMQQPAQPQQQQMVGGSPWGMPFQQQPQQQPNGFMAAQPTGFASTNPFQMQATGAAPFVQQQAQQPQQPQQSQPLTTAFTGMGFGGFTAQSQQPQQTAFQPSTLAPIPQNTAASFQPPQPPNNSFLGLPQMAMPTGQQQNTNPFRQSMLAPNPTGLQGLQGMQGMQGLQGMPNMPNMQTSMATTASPLVAAPTGSTNPFARSSMLPAQQPQIPAAAPLVPMRTGTNPFARDYSSQLPQRPATSGGPALAAAAATLAPQPTGTTNPFRQSAFVNQQTGLGWQHSQPTGQLLDHIETLPVFPRPAPQTPWQ